MLPYRHSRSRRVTVIVIEPKGFTLIELLVVISIIALLIGILLPALGAARGTARTNLNLSNLRQIGIGINNYLADRNQYFPFMSSDAVNTTNLGGTLGNAMKPRWVDYMFPYMSEPQVFRNPHLDLATYDRMKNPFWHQVSNVRAEVASLSDTDVSGMYLPNMTTDTPEARQVQLWGGYGYNFQYLGNSRDGAGPGAPNGWNGRMDADVKNPARTIFAGDTQGAYSAAAGGSSPEDWWVTETSSRGVYNIDPPLGSHLLGSQGNGKQLTAAYYESATNGGHDFNPANGSNQLNDANNTYVPRTKESQFASRATPALRNQGKAGVVWGDGHATANALAELDDSDGNGFVDNGNWNGLGDATLK